VDQHQHTPLRHRNDVDLGFRSSERLRKTGTDTVTVLDLDLDLAQKIPV
jgi:hypothetical protein